MSLPVAVMLLGVPLVVRAVTEKRSSATADEVRHSTQHKMGRVILTADCIATSAKNTCRCKDRQFIRFRSAAGTPKGEGILRESEFLIAPEVGCDMLPAENRT